MISQHLKINTVRGTWGVVIGRVQGKQLSPSRIEANAKGVMKRTVPGAPPGTDAPHGRSIFLISFDRVHAAHPRVGHEQKEGHSNSRQQETNAKLVLAFP